MHLEYRAQTADSDFPGQPVAYSLRSIVGKIYVHREMITRNPDNIVFKWPIGSPIIDSQ